MSSSPWNRPLPERIILGGPKRFIDPLPDPSQSWEITGERTSSPALIIRSLSENSAGKLTLQAAFSEGPLGERVPPSIYPLGPVLDHQDWDWVEFHCQPLPDLNEEVIIWVPDPRIICGSHRLQNTGLMKRQINLKLTCLGEKSEQGIRFSSADFQGRNILSGSSSSQKSVLFVTGGEFYPSQPSNQLITTAVLEPESKTELRWILIWCDTSIDPEPFLEEAIKYDWDGEIGLRKITLSSQIQIRTGKAEQDFALACSRRQARLILNQLFLHSNHGEPSLDLRQIWQLILALEPLDHPTLEFLIRTAFRGRSEKGPGFPIGAELLWRTYRAGLEPDIIREFLPALIEDLLAWFSDKNDRDGDGVPEDPGGNYFQLEKTLHQEENSLLEAERIEDHLETPGLAALLLNELSQLKKLGEVIPGTTIPPDLINHIQTLEGFLLDSWNDSELRFRTRDYQTHISKGGCSLPGMVQNGWNIFRIDLAYPTRLRLHIPIISENQTSEKLSIIFQGRDWRGNYRVEELTAQDILWSGSGGWGTTQCIYSWLDYCVVKGLEKDQAVLIKAPGSDRQDLSHTLALWSESSADSLGEKIVSGSLSRSGPYWSDFGWKTYPSPENTPVQLPLNILVSQGLIKSGQKELAGEVFKSWLEAAGMNISMKGYLFSSWESGSGSGLGKMEQLESTLPVGMLMDLLGLRFLINGDLILEKRNPLLYPLELIYRGVEITLEEKETIICRPGGDRMILPRGKETLIPF